MKLVLKIAGLLGYVVAMYSVLSSFTFAPPSFNVARLNLEDKTKNEPLSVAQSAVVKESFDLAQRLSKEDQTQKIKAAQAAQLGLVLVSTVCLIAGFSSTAKKRANQALVTTATNPPPSTTPPAPLSHL